MTLENKNNAYDLARFAIYTLNRNGGLKAAFQMQWIYISLIITGWLLAFFLWQGFPALLVGGIFSAVLIFWNAPVNLLQTYQKHYEKYYQPVSELRGFVNEKEILEIKSDSFVVKKDFCTTSTLWSNVQLHEDNEYWYIFITPLSAVVLRKSDHNSPEAHEFISHVREKSLPLFQ